MVMKRGLVISLLCVLVVVLNGCQASSKSKTKAQPEPTPQLDFQALSQSTQPHVWLYTIDGAENHLAEQAHVNQVIVTQNGQVTVYDTHLPLSQVMQMTAQTTINRAQQADRQLFNQALDQLFALNQAGVQLRQHALTVEWPQVVRGFNPHNADTQQFITTLQAVQKQVITQPYLPPVAATLAVGQQAHQLDLTTYSRQVGSWATHPAEIVFPADFDRFIAVKPQRYGQFDTIRQERFHGQNLTFFGHTGQVEELIAWPGRAEFG
ncbi:hypothetical protein DY78_GL001303 [Lactiplantibacillus fabifermentans DSM 21115]|uniref:Lipoprotein n=2 Tax=Lactiplantibacillus fabifermentans TaxID=483011 RepID=A0A0R2NJU9_9LACO|nr:hypothetical protein DY78_GL001303 [Lactiplantibacillus fabifermentans DSM 21115]